MVSVDVKQHQVFVETEICREAVPVPVSREEN